MRCILGTSPLVIVGLLTPSESDTPMEALDGEKPKRYQTRNELTTEFAAPLSDSFKLLQMAAVTPLAAELPELAHLSREDLEDMIREPAYFHALFHSLDRVKALYQAQAELGMANESIARNNLALQEDLYRLRSETKDAFDEAKALEARWRQVEREQKEVYQRFTPQFFLMRLRHATIAQDDQSETLASAFVQSSSTEAPSPPNSTSKEIEDFISEFKSSRKIYHKRVMWGERWAAGQVTWRQD